MRKRSNYQAPRSWTGGMDGPGGDVQRWHQRVQIVHLYKDMLPGIQTGQRGLALAGTCLNIRQVCANLPVHFGKDVVLIDIGKVAWSDAESAFEILRNAGYRVLFFGEMDYSLNSGVISLSTQFLRLAKEQAYLALGIQTQANTRRAFAYAQSVGTQWLLYEELFADEYELYQTIEQFASGVESLHLCIDLDAFNTIPAIAPDAAFIRLYDRLLDLPNLDIVQITGSSPGNTPLVAFLAFQTLR